MIKYNIDEILSGIRNGKPTDDLKIKIEDELDRLPDANEKATYLRKLYKAYFSTNNDISFAMNAFHSKLKAYTKERLIANMAQSNDNSSKLRDSPNFKDVAIEITANKVEKTELCTAALRKYAIHKDEHTKRKIFTDYIDDEGDFEASLQTFYKWTNKYNKNLNVLTGAQE